jgi:hypothetical protein
MGAIKTVMLKVDGVVQEAVKLHQIFVSIIDL